MVAWLVATCSFVNLNGKEGSQLDELQRILQVTNPSSILDPIPIFLEFALPCLNWCCYVKM